MARLTTYQVCEIAKDTYVINEAGMAAMFLVTGRQRALLIDTGVGMTDLKALVASITPLPYDVVLTHGHMDHVGGAAQFEEVYIHEADADSLNPIDYDAIAGYVELLGKMGAYDVYDCGPDSVMRSTQMPKVKPLREGMIFDLGGRCLEVLETPGHTPGGCSLLDRTERILFSGDACNVNLLCMGNSVNTLLGALDKIKSHESEFDRNFNGHVGYAGAPMTMSMPVSVLDDAIHICEDILGGTAVMADGDGPFDRNSKVVSYGHVRIVFSPDRIIDEGESRVRN